MGTWRPGDAFPADARALEAHPYMEAAAGRVALARGPLLYCLEEADAPAGVDIRDLQIGDAASFKAAANPDLLGGVVTLFTEASSAASDARAFGNALYRPVPASQSSKSLPAASIPIRLVPYFAWANRTPGRMQVWMKRAPQAR